MVYMKWLSKRREAKMIMNGCVRLKYLLHLLPDRIMIQVDHFHGTMNRTKAAEKYGEYFIWFIQPRGYDIEIVLHEQPEGEK